MKKLVPILLLILGIVLLILGIDAYQEATASFNFLGLEVSASEESGQQRAIIYFALALVSLAGSFLIWKRS